MISRRYQFMYQVLCASCGIHYGSYQCCDIDSYIRCMHMLQDTLAWLCTVSIPSRYHTKVSPLSQQYEFRLGTSSCWNPLLKKVGYVHIVLRKFNYTSVSRCGHKTADSSYAHCVPTCIWRNIGQHMKTMIKTLGS